jgi:adenylate cyclase
MCKSAAVENKSLVILLSQLKDRKVLRVAIAYMVVAWIVMQVGEVTFEALQLPEWALTMLICFSLLGFPIVLVLAWAYEITPGGIVRDIDGNLDYVGINSAHREAVATTSIIEMEPSIAVLPFEDMSYKKDQNYFCEGIAEEILCALNEVHGLHVAARVASFQFGSKSADILEIGRLLNVSVVLEGSVRKAGDRIRTTVQLINAQDGYQFWASQYDHDMKDVFEIQEQIAQAVVNAMRLSISENTLTQPKTQSTEAYDLYLKGNRFFNQTDKQGFVFARQLFKQAVEVDPGYGLAWAKLASTYAHEYMCSKRDAGVRNEARRVSLKALELAPEIPESHIARGIAHSIFREYREADLEFETAIGLNPNSFEAWFTYARSKNYQGDVPKAIEFYGKAAEIRQEDYQCVLLQVSLLKGMGDLKGARAKAKEGLRKARAFLKINPDDNRAWNMGASALQTLGKLTEAEEWVQTSLSKSPRDSVITYNAACFYALVGDVDRALDYLAQSADVGCLNLDWLEQDSDLDSIRDNPRFEEIIAHFKG